MKLLIFCSLLAVSAYAKSFQPLNPSQQAYGYIRRVAIPQAERLREAEKEYLANPTASRILGGSPAGLGQIPWQAGLIIEEENWQGVCGGVLISNQRVLMAGHCWDDWTEQARSITVVLGTVTLFSGGVRVWTNEVVLHPLYFPVTNFNDIAVAYLPTAVTVTANISPVALPVGEELTKDFSGEIGTVAGFGATTINGGTSPNLNFIERLIITEEECLQTYPVFLHDGNVCTSGVGGVGPCNGDSGGPLTVISNGRPMLLGIVAFGSGWGCDYGEPVVYCSTQYYNSFIRENL